MEIFTYESTIMAGPIPIDIELKVEVEIKIKITLNVDLTKETSSLELNPIATVSISLEFHDPLIIYY